MPDLDSPSPPHRRVMHNHTSRLLFAHSVFIISHFELSASSPSPPPPHPSLCTAVASNYDNSNSWLGGIWLSLPSIPEYTPALRPTTSSLSDLFVCSMSSVSQLVYCILSANGNLAAAHPKIGLMENCCRTIENENCSNTRWSQPDPGAQMLLCWSERFCHCNGWKPWRLWKSFFIFSVSTTDPASFLKK